MRFVIAVCLLSLTVSVRAETAEALFAGGCFWCMEPPFDKVDGVISTTSGYTGGHVEDPGYEQVSGGGTGHYESLQVKYDPARVSYEKLLDVYWHNIDPFDGGGQFCDRGPQYRAAIFTRNEEQEALARESKQVLQEKTDDDHQIVTEILPAKTFYPAEEYHQNYYKKNSLRYKFYRYSCGRDQRLKEVHEIIWPHEPED